MPSGSTRINKALTNVSVKYMNNEYIAGQILSDIPVLKESDNYWIYANDFRLEESERANGARANQITHGFSTAAYYVKEHALKDVITDRDRMNTDAPLNLDIDMTENLTDHIMNRQEYEAMKALMTTTTFSNNATLTSITSWKYHTTTSAPIQNVLSGTGKIISSASRRPNIGVCGWGTFEALKENPNLYGRIQYVERAILTENLIASLFDLDNVYVGTALYDSAKEGETETLGYIWPSDFLLAYKNPSMGLRKVTYATTFRVTSKGMPYRVKKWREEDVEGDYIEVQTMFQHRAIATACAYLFKTVAL